MRLGSLIQVKRILRLSNEAMHIFTDNYQPSFNTKTYLSACPHLFDFLTFPYAGFTSHQAVARTAGNVLVRLADSLLLPFNCSDYAESLELYLSQAVTAFEEKLAAKAISMGELTRFKLLWMREMLALSLS